MGFGHDCVCNCGYANAYESVNVNVNERYEGLCMCDVVVLVFVGLLAYLVGRMVRGQSEAMYGVDTSTCVWECDYASVDVDANANDNVNVYGYANVNGYEYGNVNVNGYDNVMVIPNQQSS